MNPTLVSIIIVNYNVKFFLENCLLSVQKAVSSISSEIIVCDNCSTDGSKAYLEERFSSVHFIWLDTNVGYACGNNIALQKANGEFILFLNPDTIIAENTLQLCMKHLQQHATCGAVGVRMIDGAGKFLQESKRGLPTPARALGKMSGLYRLMPKMFGGYYAGHIDENQTADVDVLAGAFFFTRKNILQKIGSFDERFFMFGEDVDLSYRIQQAGYKNTYLPKTTIIHFKGESSQRKSASYNKHFYGAMHLFVQKHPGKNKWLMHLAISVSAKVAKLKNLIPLEIVRNKTFQKTAIVCSQTSFSPIVRIVKNAAITLLIVGRVSIQSNDTDHCIGNIAQLEALIHSGSIQQIIFAGNDISNEVCIRIMEQFAGKIDFLFLQQNSNSIVGSNDKNKNGIFIAAS